MYIEPLNKDMFLHYYAETVCQKLCNLQVLLVLVNTITNRPVA